MTNYTTDPEQIKAAAEKGLITAEDYNKWKGIQGYKSCLKKSREESEISKSIFAQENEKADSYFFERDMTSNQFRYVLRGVEFQPIDLFKQHDVIKSIQQVPLQRTQRVRVDNIATQTEAVKRKVTAFYDDCVRVTEALKKRG